MGGTTIKSFSLRTLKQGICAKRQKSGCILQGQNESFLLSLLQESGQVIQTQEAGVHVDGSRLLLLCVASEPERHHSMV